MNMNLLCSREPLRVCEVVVVQNHKVIKEERKKKKEKKEKKETLYTRYLMMLLSTADVELRYSANRVREFLSLYTQ